MYWLTAMGTFAGTWCVMFDQILNAHTRLYMQRQHKGGSRVDNSGSTKIINSTKRHIWSNLGWYPSWLFDVEREVATPLIKYVDYNISLDANNRGSIGFLNKSVVYIQVLRWLGCCVERFPPSRLVRLCNFNRTFFSKELVFSLEESAATNMFLPQTLKELTCQTWMWAGSEAKVILTHSHAYSLFILQTFAPFIQIYSYTVLIRPYSP